MLMKMKNLVVVLCVVFLPLLGSAQEQDIIYDPLDGASYSKRMNILATEQMADLREGVLIVRLQSKKEAIDTLRAMGQHKRAQKLEKTQEKYNKTIVKAFREEFDFAPVLFIYSHQSKAVIDRRFKDVVFLNDDLQPDSGIELNFDKFLTAQFGMLRQYPENNQLADESGSHPEETQTTGPASLPITALFFMDSEFNQLHRPFPFYTRTFDGLRTPDRVVEKMNLKLHEFVSFED